MMSRSNGKHYHINFELILKAPFMTKSSGAMRFGLDTFSQQENGSLVINGSQLKGVIRHQLVRFNQLLNDEQLAKLIGYAFGPQPQQPEYHSFDHAALTFPWKLTEQGEEQVSVEPEKLYRIKMNQETGTVEEGHIQVIESKYPVGTLVTFTGRGRYIESQTVPADILQSWLNKALQAVSAIGAFKSIGFGEVVSAKCTVNKKLPSPSIKDKTVKPLNQVPLRVAFNADRPICFAKPRSKTSNTFVSEDFIPGNALKAALINSHYFQSLEANSPLKEHINQLVVSHAKPIAVFLDSDSQRAEKIPLPKPWSQHLAAQTLPLSLMQFSIPACDNGQPQECYLDVAELNTAVLIQKDNMLFSGAFESDRKGDVPLSVRQAYGANLPEMKRELLVRTAVNASTQSAEDGSLFSYDTLRHEDLTWIVEFSLPKISESGEPISDHTSEVIGRQVLEVVHQGLFNLGKTKATLEFQDSYSGSGCTGAFKRSDTTQKLSLKLESDALLFDAKDLKEINNNQQDQLFSLVANYFAQLVFTDVAVPLVACYADTQLVGGDYLLNRFYKPSAYQPQIVVKAGSVFTFDLSQLTSGEREQVFIQVEKILHTGLPSPNKGWDFNTTPYLPQNGFAKITWLSNEIIAQHQILPSGYTLVDANTLQPLGGQDD